MTEKSIRNRSENSTYSCSFKKKRYISPENWEEEDFDEKRENGSEFMSPSSNFNNHNKNEHRNTITNNSGIRSRINVCKYKNEDKIFINVNSDKVGKLIGKQGVKIRELQNTTGTQILVGKSYNGTTRVTIIGSPESRERCKEIIQKLTEEVSLFSLSSAETEGQKFIEKEKEHVVIDWDTLNKQADEYEKLKWAKCPPLKKNFYFEHPEVASMSELYVQKLRKSLNNITVSYSFQEDTETRIPKPVENFEQAFSHYPEILEEIKKQGFDKPFPIQCQAWPILLSGMDMIGIAQTGTGKTLAFLLPALIHTDGQDIPLSQRSGPNVLVLAPTRELALQIDKEVRKYSYRNIKSVCVYGGGNRREQVNVITNGVQIIIATPGRLNDLIESGVIKVESITFVILDEADRMLDMGFEPQIRKTLLDIRPDKQIIMTSATWPFAVQNLAQKYMKNPVQVVVGSLDLAAVHSVKQTVLIIKDEEKMDYLLDYINNLSEEDKVIIFVDKKALADAISCDLILKNIDCQSIHGNREQIDREQAIDDLKTGSVRILVATDVASRGIDITDITKVINYDFPRNIEEYVHRVGRTGRAGKTGESITFFTRGDWSYAKELISILEEANQEVPEELFQMRERFESAKEKRQNSGRSRDQFGRFAGFGKGGCRFGKW